MIGVLGSSCLIFTAVWKLVLIQAETKAEKMRRDRSSVVPATISEEIKEANPPDKYLTEASSVWFNVGLVLTMIQPLVTIMGAFTLDNNLFSLAVFVSPFTTLAYTANVFSQPRRQGFREMWRIRLQGLLFAGISELALVVWALRTDDLRGIHPDFKQKVGLSIEKIARMQDISIRRGAVGLLTLVSGVCGIFLFSMMSAEEIDDQLSTILIAVGGSAIMTSAMWELFACLRYQREEKALQKDLHDDEENRAAIVKLMEEDVGEPLLDQDQKDVFERCSKLLGTIGKDEWKVLKFPSYETKMWYKFSSTEDGVGGKRARLATGKAEATLDCSAQEAAAWQMDFCSKERKRVSRSERNPARFELTEKAKRNEICLATVKRFPFPIDNREFVVRQIWKSEGLGTKVDKVLIAFESIDDEVDYGKKLKKTRGLTSGMFIYENLRDRAGANQCKVTLVQNVESGGYVPVWVLNKMLPQQLSSIQQMVDIYRKDDEIDKAEIDEIARKIKASNSEVYSEEENKLFEDVKSFYEGLSKDGWQSLHSPNKSVVMEMRMKEGVKNTNGVARGQTIVDASTEECFAYEHAMMSRRRMREHYEHGGVDRKLDPLNAHSDVFYYSYDFKVPGLAIREWLTKCVWKKEDDGNTLILCYNDFKDDDNYPVGGGPGKKYIRGKSFAFWKYERVPENPENQCYVTWAIHVQAEGFVPAPMVRSGTVNNLKFLDGMREYFMAKNEVYAGTEDGKNEEPVLEISWWLVAMCFLVTSAYVALNVISAMQEDRLDNFVSVSEPVAGVIYAMSVFFKCKRNDKGYMRFFYFHFFSFLAIIEIAKAVGYLRKGVMFGLIFQLVKITVWVLMFVFALRLREAAGELKPKRLSEFLCTTILLKGSASIGPMSFFAFEAVSCFISQGSLDSKMCHNTSTAGGGLSMYIALFVLNEFANHTVPKGVLREVSWDYHHVATLKLKWWQRLQGILLVITALVSLYLLSFVGVEGEPVEYVGKVVAAGFLACASFVGINAFMITRTHDEFRLPPDSMSSRSMRSRSSMASRIERSESNVEEEDDDIASTELGEGMVLASLM
ncbi:hypothetical protein TrST_g11050 [Triparma strigata]|uniref:START domain-containing protein n=1 Tax=Triparma strigata TaxID=1606541 RepID=A0A9W6ZJ63_9STRA|nr:hypothetical protein TrST_g11050 [Triparma strigata]